MLTVLLILTFCCTFANCVDPIYLGCFDRFPVLGDVVGVYLYYGESPHDRECNCATISYDYGYAYDTYGDELGLYETCYCTNVAPNFEYFRDPGDRICFARPSTYLDVKITLGSIHTYRWNGAGCYTPNSSIQGISVTSVPECLDHCEAQSLPHAALIVHQDNNLATCGCYSSTSTWQGHEATHCTFERWQTFSRIPQPSAGVRKREARIRSGPESILCPAGMTACRVKDQGEWEFECLDISNDLESCGGCIHGEMDISNLSKPKFGIDCTSLPGVAANGFTCFRGECIAFACEEGFELVNDRCAVQHG